MSNTIHIPIEATYRIVNGKAVRIDAVYADVSADAIAQMLLKTFHVSVDEVM